MTVPSFTDIDCGRGPNNQRVIPATDQTLRNIVAKRDGSLFRCSQRKAWVARFADGTELTGKTFGAIWDAVHRTMK